MRRRTLELDDTCPIHYEPDIRFESTDFFSQMYATVGKVKRIGAGQPCAALPLQLWPAGTAGPAGIGPAVWRAALPAL